MGKQNDEKVVTFAVTVTKCLTEKASMYKLLRGDEVVAAGALAIGSPQYSDR